MFEIVGARRCVAFFSSAVLAHAQQLDKAAGNTLWMDALKKEMKTVSVAFDVLEEGAAEPKQGRQFIPCLLRWDVKNFTLQSLRKAR